MKKSPEGTGIIAGGPARSVLELAGFKNIRTKVSGFPEQAERCTCKSIAGLNELKTPEEVAKTPRTFRRRSFRLGGTFSMADKLKSR